MGNRHPGAGLLCCIQDRLNGQFLSLGGSPLRYNGGIFPPLFPEPLFSLLEKGIILAMEEGDAAEFFDLVEDLHEIAGQQGIRLMEFAGKTLESESPCIP